MQLYYTTRCYCVHTKYHIVHIGRAHCQNSSIINLNLALLHQSQHATVAKCVRIEIYGAYLLPNPAGIRGTVAPVKKLHCNSLQTGKTVCQMRASINNYTTEIIQSRSCDGETVSKNVVHSQCFNWSAEIRRIGSCQSVILELSATQKITKVLSRASRKQCHKFWSIQDKWRQDLRNL